MNETGLGQAVVERKSALLVALSQLESEVDSLKGQGMTAIESSFKSIMLQSPPVAGKDAPNGPAPAQSEALEIIERIHGKVCQINGRIHDFQNRSQA
jgi:hypothetical protein